MNVKGKERKEKKVINTGVWGGRKKRGM